MKQPKQKAQPVKSPRKAAKSELKDRLLTTLKNIFEQDKIKLTKKIKKQSKKLVKAVANKLVIAKPATEKSAKANTATKAPKPAKAAASVKNTKAKPAASAKDTTPKATPAKATPAKASEVAKPAAKSKAEKK